MEYPSRIPSQLRPFEIKGLTVSEYPVTEDNGEYYIEVDIESRGSMFVTFYDENGNKLDDVNYKLSEDKITIYIGEPAYNRLDLVIFSNGEHFDQLDIWAQNPENHMELFSLDLYDIPKKTDPDYETKMAVLNEYRLAVGRKSAPTYNMTIQEILRYFEQEGIFPLFLRVDGYLRNVAGFDNSAARSNLEILSKEEIWGRWNSDNEYANPTGLMYNQNLFNGGGDGTDGRLPNSDVELLRDNNASLHLYGLNQNMPDKARRIEMNNVVAVKGEWNKYVWPYLDYSSAYKIKKVIPTTVITPVFKDGYYREGGIATPFMERDILDSDYGILAMFKEAITNNILFQKKYWNNTQNTGAGHNMDNRIVWYMSVIVNLHFAVPKNVNHAILNFDATGQVKQYLDSLLLSTTQKYDLDMFIEGTYTVLTGQRFRTHYKGKCYNGPENAYNKNEDSNSLTYYGYDSYNNPASGTREPQSLFDFESTTPFYPHGSYKGDLYPGPNSDSDKYVSNFIVGNANSGWNAKNSGIDTIVPDSNSNIWHNRSVAYLAFNHNVGKYCIMLFMQPAINKENNINDWGNNEWWIEGDSMLM